jgi:ABC-type transport system involved in multi-copper enzyme maturation permease subunit
MLLPLLWKDIRLNKYVILLAIFLVDTPYVTTAFGLSLFTGEPEGHTSLAERLAIAFPFSAIFAAIASAFIGASPIGAEKAERTDRFLDYLPPTRLTVVTSKVLIAIGLLALAWLGPTIVYFTCLRPEPPGGLKIALSFAVAASLMLFGLAWLASCYVKSSMISVLAAFIGAAGAQLAVRRILLITGHGNLAAPQIAQVMLWSSVGIGILALSAGAVIALRAPAE